MAKEEKKGDFFQYKDGEIVFKDCWGTVWSAEVLDDLIKALRKQQDVRETIEYYEDMASKVRERV